MAIKKREFAVGYGSDAAKRAEEAVFKSKNAFTRVMEATSASEYLEDQLIQNIPIDSLIPDPNNRMADKRIEEFAYYIKKFGFLSVFVVQNLGNGKYMLVSGERRWRAIMHIRKTEPDYMRGLVPAYVLKKDAPKNQVEDIGITMNLATEDPTPEEMIGYIKKLKESFNSDPNAPTSLTKYLSYTLDINIRQVQKFTKIERDLSEDLKQLLYKNEITIDDANKYSSLTEDAQKILYEKYKEKNKIDPEDYAALKIGSEEDKKEIDRLKKEIDDLHEQIQNLQSTQVITENFTDDEEKEHLKKKIRELEEKQEHTKMLLENARKTSKVNSLNLEDLGKQHVYDEMLNKLYKSVVKVKKFKGYEVGESDKIKIKEIVDILSAIIE